MKKTVLLFLALPLLIMGVNGQTTDMRPIVMPAANLPLNLEGYTVNVRSNGTMALYDTYSNEPARNIYNQGGVRIEIGSLERIPNFIPGRQADLPGILNDLRTRRVGLIKGTIYKSNVIITSGGDFDNRRRKPDKIQGPTSQVVIHLPSSVRIVERPIIKVDGITQSEQMVHNLLNIGSVALLFLPGATPLAVGFKDMIYKALDKVSSDFLVHSAYSSYKPSETIEVNERVSLGKSNNVQQISWVLGGHKKRDISSAKTAELTIYLKFEEEGSYDMSLFFNIWGTHSYTPTSPATMHLNNLVLHSFRQHVVLNANVVGAQ